MAGDESALPAIAASLEKVPEGRPCVALVVVDDREHEPDVGALDITWLHRSSAANPADLLTDTVAGLDLPEGRVDVFVHGEAGEVRAVRKHLLGDRGIPKEQTSISPYWRRDHTDECWREIKRDWLAEVEQDV